MAVLTGVSSQLWRAVHNGNLFKIWPNALDIKKVKVKIM